MERERGKGGGGGGWERSGHKIEASHVCTRVQVVRVHTCTCMYVVRDHVQHVVKCKTCTVPVVCGTSSTSTCTTYYVLPCR